MKRAPRYNPMPNKPMNLQLFAEPVMPVTPQLHTGAPITQPVIPPVATGAPLFPPAAQTGQPGAPFSPVGWPTATTPPQAANLADEPAQVTDPQANQPPPRTFTQEDVNRIVQREKADVQKKIEAEVAKAVTEAQRMANMTAEQRAEEERKKAILELGEREKAITTRELRATALETLAQRGLPTELAGSLSYENADACMKSLDGIERAFRAALQKGIEEQMKGRVPSAGQPGKPPQPSTKQGKIAQELTKLLADQS